MCATGRASMAFGKHRLVALLPSVFVRKICVAAWNSPSTCLRRFRIVYERCGTLHRKEGEAEHEGQTKGKLSSSTPEQRLFSPQNLQRGGRRLSQVCQTACMRYETCRHHLAQQRAEVGCHVGHAVLQCHGLCTCQRDRC